MSTNTSIDDLRMHLRYHEGKGDLTAAEVQSLIEEESARTAPRKSMISMLNGYLNRAKKKEEAS